MMNFEHSQSVCNRLCNNADMEHQSKMNYLVQQEEFNLFVMLKPKLYKDGNMWCVLYGDNIQEGICGFGKSPILAIYEFNKAWREEIQNIPNPTQP